MTGSLPTVIPAQAGIQGGGGGGFATTSQVAGMTVLDAAYFHGNDGRGTACLYGAGSVAISIAITHAPRGPHKGMKMTGSLPTVIPAKAGIQGRGCGGLRNGCDVSESWIPAFAGMTVGGKAICHAIPLRVQHEDLGAAYFHNKPMEQPI